MLALGSGYFNVTVYPIHDSMLAAAEMVRVAKPGGRVFIGAKHESLLTEHSLVIRLADDTMLPLQATSTIRTNWASQTAWECSACSLQSLCGAPSPSGRT